MKRSPALSALPAPVRHALTKRVHALAIDEEDPTASLEHALAIAQSFGLAAKASRAVAAEVARSIRRWRAAAAAVDLSKSQIERMATAFEHADLRAAGR